MLLRARVHVRARKGHACQARVTVAMVRGLGLRSRRELAHAAYCACLAESAEHFLHDATGTGGFFQMLQPLFQSRSQRLRHFLPGWPAHTAAREFAASWQGRHAKSSPQQGARSLQRR